MRSFAKGMLEVADCLEKALEAVPASHFEHEPSPSSEYLPESHSVHDAAPSALNVPARHA